MKILGLSYKRYLQVISSKSKSSIYLKGILFLALIAFITLGSLSSLYYFRQKALAPQLARQAYLSKTVDGLNSTKKAFEEVLSVLQVAGTKVEAIDSFRESSKSAAGFYQSLDNYQKTIAMLESTKSNIESEKTSLEKAKTPPEYEDIKNEAIAFYEDANRIIDAHVKKYIFSKELLLALGPEFYSTSLTKSFLWKENNEKEIIGHYKKIKEEAGTSLIRLAKLTVDARYKGLLGLEISYLEQIVNLSDNIVNTLSVKNIPVGDEASSTEAAYQLLIGAQRENEELYSKLQKERDKIFNVGQNINELVAFVDRQDSIAGKFINLTKLNGQSNIYKIDIPFIKGI